MKISFFLFCTILISCNNQDNETADQNRSQKKLSKKSIESKLPLFVDLSVSGLKLLDPISTEKIIGLSIMDKKKIFTPITLTNKDGTEILETDTMSGGVRYELATFKIYSTNKNKKHHKKLNTLSKFTTSKGIQLGMTYKRVLNILKVKNEYDHNNIEIKSEIVLNDQYHIYYGKYSFKKGLLYKAEWGFMTP